MVASGAQERLGAVVSSTEMVWLQVAALPHSSVAVQVRLTRYLILPPAAQVPGRVSSLWSRRTVLQASVGTGSTNWGMAGHSMVLSCSQVWMGVVRSWADWRRHG